MFLGYSIEYVSVIHWNRLSVFLGNSVNYVSLIQAVDYLWFSIYSGMIRYISVAATRRKVPEESASVTFNIVWEEIERYRFPANVVQKLTNSLVQNFLKKLCSH